jgi:hypothetical protein
MNSPTLSASSASLEAKPRTDRRPLRLASPYAKTSTLLRLDGRRREVRLLRETRAALMAHVGERPTATQKALVEICASLQLYVSLFDAKALREGGLGERDSRQYLAYSNSLTRALARLGLNKAAQEPKPPPLTESFRPPVTSESAQEAYFRMLRARPNDAT